MNSISRRIAKELGVREQQVNATVELLDEGAAAARRLDAERVREDRVLR